MPKLLPAIAQVKRQPRIGALQERAGGHAGNLAVRAGNENVGHGTRDWSPSQRPVVASTCGV